MARTVGDADSAVLASPRASRDRLQQASQPLGIDNEPAIKSRVPHDPPGCRELFRWRRGKHLLGTDRNRKVAYAERSQRAFSALHAGLPSFNYVTDPIM